MSMFHLIKEHVSILELVQQYTTLKKAGSYWKGNCPFHHEKTASFTVSPHKEIFYCFGCHAGGDVITFIQKVEQCEPIEAIQFLAQRYNIELPKTSDNNQPTVSMQEKNSYFNLCELVALWCHENLLKNPSLLSYFKKRGFNAETIALFKIGYFPGGFTAIKSLTDYMRKHTILVNDLTDANILTAGKNVLYSPYENRIMFPIKNHLGQFCGFGGRVFMPNDERAKYYNTRENNFFLKGTLLFGFDQAKKAIQETQKVFLVEGYTDCMAMAQHGFINTVATLGTACSAHHLKTLSRYAQQIYILYDNDNAGNAAILRLTELCWQVNLELKVMCLPAGQDPASFLASNNDLQSYIDQAQDIFVFFIESLGHDFASKLIPEKILLIRKLMAIIISLDDPLKQDFLLQKASKVFGVPFETLKQELARTLPTHTDTPKPFGQPEINNTPSTAPITEGITALEKKIFCGIIKDIHLLNNYHERYLIECMPSLLKTILQHLQEKQSKTPYIDFSTFFSTLNAQEQQCVSNVLLEYEHIINTQELELLVLKLQQKQWKVIVNDIKKQLTQAKNDGNILKTKEIIDNFLQLKQKIAPHMSHKKVTLDVKKKAAIQND